MKRNLYNIDNIRKNPPKDPEGLAYSTLRRFYKILEICIQRQNQRHKLETSEGRLKCRYCGFTTIIGVNNKENEAKHVMKTLEEIFPYILECLFVAKKTNSKCLPKEMKLINALLEDQNLWNIFKPSSLREEDIYELKQYFRDNAAYASDTLKTLENSEEEQKRNHRITQMMRDAKEKIRLNRPINNALIMKEAQKKELIVCAKNYGYNLIKLKDFPFEFIIE